MKKNDIFDAFEKLDPKFVEEAAPKAERAVRRPRVWLRILAVAACVALLVGAIVVTTLLFNREDESQPDVPSDVTEPSNEKKKYEIYMNFSAGEILDLNASANENVEFKSSSEKNFDLFSSENKIEKPANISDSIDVKIGGKSFSFNYDSAYETALNNIQKFESFGNNVVYETNDDKITLELSASTKELVFFSDWQTEYNVSGEFTAEEAKEAADELLCEIYGEIFLEEYECTKTYTTDNQSDKRYSVYYMRKAFGYETDDCIFLDFNFEGELLFINAYRKGIMKFAEEDLTKEDIEGAIAAVTETFSDTWYIGNSEIILDSEGDYYLMTYLVHADDGEITELRKVYTKIK